MKRVLEVRLYLPLVLSCLLLASPLVAAKASAVHVETIVGIRHGENPGGDLGQLTCRGLNRALALPKVLIAKYGKANYIFAPNPSVRGRSLNSYVRPLMTIEPTAVVLGLPVNAQIGFEDVRALQQIVTQPKYEDALIFIAWEHGNLARFAANLMKTYGGNPSVVPSWPQHDYDSIYVIRLTRRNGQTSVSFTHDHENLNGRLSDKCPGY